MWRRWAIGLGVVAVFALGAAPEGPGVGLLHAPPGAAHARGELFFQAPAPGLLAGPGDIAVSLDVPAPSVPGSLVVELDGAPLAPGALSPRPGGVAGTLSGLAEAIGRASWRRRGS